MEESSNLNEQDCDANEQDAPPLTNIIMHNVRDLTLSGLTNLCSNYGSVVNVRKTKTNPNIAFIEFKTESDATMAIQQLNGKLGFGYRAQFLYPRFDIHGYNKDKAKSQEAPVQRGNTIATAGTDWEKESVKRRFNFSLLPPLMIKFPEPEPLCTKPDYVSASTGPLLRKVDPELFFSIQQVESSVGKPTKPTKSSDSSERQERLNAHVRTSAGGQFTADSDTFTHSGLDEAALATFGAVQHCVVCGGYGFVYCAKCGTHYCSTVHQREHLSKHDLICTSNNVGQPEPSDKLAKAEVAALALPPVGHANVLTRDALPSKENVYITAVLTHDRVFVRSADPAVEREYLKTLADCEAASLRATRAVDSQALTPGEIYLAPGPSCGPYGRVLLIEVGAHVSKCVFIEHGTLCSVKNASLKLITDSSLKYRKVHVYRVCLADVVDEFGERDKAIAYLTKLVVRRQRLVMKHRNEANNMVDVQLSNSQGVSLHETINRLIIIPPVLSDEAHQAYIMYDDIPKAIPAMGDSRHIMILNRSTIQFDGRVTWIAMDDLPYLESLQRKLEHYGKKVSDFRRYFTPRIGELCLVRTLGRWYRAVCHETVGDFKPALFLCDYGCMVIADLLDIRKIPSQLATEVRTHDGIVRGLLEAKSGGLLIDSEFLDIYLPENEPLLADVSQVSKQDSLIEGEPPEVYNMLNMHLYSDFSETLVGRIM